jgi:uncharacterized protein (PEP-CTERM system associated)
MPWAANACRLLAVAAVLPFGVAHCESWTIVPQVSVSETYSTNMALTSAPALEGWISDIAPGLHIEGKGARVKANLDYGRHILHYAGNPDLERNMNSLASTLNVEAIDQWLFLDASANIVQRNRSPFEAVTVDTGTPTGNLAETRTLQLSPYLRGGIPDVAAYQLRFTAIDSRSDDASLATTRVDQWTGSIGNASAGAAIGWSLDASATDVRNNVIGDRSNVRLRAGLRFELMPELHVSVSTGRERTDYATPFLERTTTPGLGLQWSPSPRTQFAIQAERRFFGTALSALLSHRTALTNWRYSDIKDVAVLPTLLSASSRGAIAELMSDLLAASIPDPAARAEAVRARLDRNGAILNQAGEGDLQTSRLFISRTREASVAMIAPRDTVTFSLAQRDQQAIGNAPGVIDSFALSNNIREQSASLAWIHRLTPLSTLNLATVRLRSEGLSDINLRSNQWAQTASLTFRLSPRTFVSLGARTIRFDSTINGAFRENAVAISLTQRF